VLSAAIEVTFKLLLLVLIVALACFVLMLLAKPFLKAALNFGWDSLFSWATLCAVVGITWAAIKMNVIRDLIWAVIKLAFAAIGALF